MARPFGAKNKDRPFRAALIRALGIADNDPEKLDELAEALLSKAKGGDTVALREVADRLDGRVPQAIAGDDHGPPVTVRTIITGLPPSSDNDDVVKSFENEKDMMGWLDAPGGADD